MHSTRLAQQERSALKRGSLGSKDRGAVKDVSRGLSAATPTDEDEARGEATLEGSKMAATPSGVDLRSVAVFRWCSLRSNHRLPSVILPGSFRQAGRSVTRCGRFRLPARFLVGCLGQRVIGTLLLALLAAFCAENSVLAQDASAGSPAQAVVAEPPGTDKESANEKPVEQAKKSYLGRIVAQPMGHQGAPWLIRPERDQEENATESFEKLGLKPGMVACDLGCGNGYWTLPMARDVGAKGIIYAVDIQREMLQKLRQRADRFDLKNIRPVLGTIDDPKIPVGELDLVLMVDVYHEFSHPVSMLWEIRRSLKPDGVIALLEYREEDPTVPIKPLHKMSKRQIMKEYEANGFQLVREYNELPWQHLMFFGRDDGTGKKIEPESTAEVLKRIKK